MAESSSSSPPAAAVTEKSEEEIEEVLDRMLTRLALCDDSKLQNLLSNLLPLSISSLSSPSPAVRNKVIEILSHVNKRVKHQPEIGLPLSELWKLYMDTHSVPMVKNFCIVYIEMAFERSNFEEKETMAPILVANISKLPSQHQEIILRITVKVIGDCHSTRISDEAAAKYRVICGTPDSEIFLEFWLHAVLYQLPTQGGGCPPGLSVSQSNRVRGKDQLKIDELLIRKLGILNVVEAMELAPEVVYPLYMAACADGQVAVVKRGEELIKKKASGVNLDDANLISRLFLLFNGSAELERIAPESRVIPGNPALRVRLMSVFCRSITAANSFPSTLQCIFGCIYGSGTTSRLKQIGMEFTVWVFKHARIDQLKLMGPVILNGIVKSLDHYSASESDTIARDTKSFAYQAIGLLAQRMPQLFKDKVDMAVRLFNALRSEAQFLRLIVQDATNSLAVAYKDAPTGVLKDLEALLLINSQSEQSEVRFCAVRWATSLFEMQHCPSRFICMLGAADSKLDIREMALEGLFPGKGQRGAADDCNNLQYPKLGDLLDYICFEADVEQYRRGDRIVEYWPSVGKMCSLLEHAMAYEGSVELHANASKALITVGSHFPEIIESRYATKVSWLKQLLGHTDIDTRESIARLLGIASGALSLSALPDLISELISPIAGSQKLRFETQHGLLCALGYVVADSMKRTHSVSESLLQATIKCLVDVVNSETATIASVAMEALGHIGLRVPLPPLDDSSSGSVLTVLHDKLSKLLSGGDIKAIQKIVISLGHIAVNDSSSSDLNIILDLIFSLCRSKIEDILFASGEALSFMWGGVPVTADVILKTNYTSLSMSSNFLTVDLSASLSRYSSTEPENNEGYSVMHPSIQQLLPEIQEAFTLLLGEQNELTQELASQGMSIVYEFGDSSMKKNLVNALVGTLTGSGKRKRAVKLVEDSEVFQEGCMGESVSGGKLGTYKELCNLANEMGQPDLIYKFMDLANYQASLNSKRGAAFGFSKIAKQAGDALQPHLRLLIPRLVRYQYDPDKNVQDAMAHIWKSLVADSKRTVDEHLDIIIDDLLAQCGSRLWRSREASCLALADIIQGRKFDQVGKHLKRIWTAAFRAMDDVKETVRSSGDRLCSAITSLTLRLCDISLTETSDARQAMDIVLPLLLTEGIMSKVDNIRKASIAVIMKLAKGAGIAIRPHLSDLVCCMLESLSSLEDQGLNYVELHAANVGIQTDKLENLRISIAKSSPMWETLDRCIDVVDVHSLELLVPRLAQLVRSGVGLNTRVGIASFISLLVQKVAVDIKPFTSILLKLLFPVVKEEKSGLSKRAFANACAVVLKYAAISQAQKLIEDTATLHTGDRNAQISCAILMKSYSSVASDILSGYHAIIVPVIFVSRFEDDKNVSSLFEEFWEENMSSERITLQLYIGETVPLICEGIMSSSWASKRKSALAISKLSQVLGESLSSHHDALLKSLMKELPGRLWEGKDALLGALAALCTSCHEAISSSDPATPNAILSLTVSACSKKVKKYREAAFCCLEQVIKAFKNPDFFSMVFPLLFEICNSTTLTKSGQVTLASDDGKADEEENSSIPNAKIVDCITACICVGHGSHIVEQQKNIVNVILILMSPGFTWTVKMSVFLLIKELCSRLYYIGNDSQETSLHTGVSSFVHELFHSASSKVVECIYAIKIGQVHIAASECLLEMTELYRDLPPVQWTEVGFKSELLHQYEAEKNEQAKSLLKKSFDVLESLERQKIQTS
ncbi:hypothetical protein Vadar_018494 [Vaccinium darrowii]|uniref:Uncharacterized protein n=1 Tax=Vaccinium darrowii TaxID=229202 RepID=A0ACB7XAN3_9ERIC|nr:hypothetical protein Vadar_018494 [Vaccinium darrowii]